MAYGLVVVAMLPLPMVFIARHFNLISDGSNKLSVSYRKGMMKDISNLEEQDEQRFILGKNPNETPSPMPAHRAYLGPGGTQEMTNTNYGTSTKTGYQNIGSPESELWSSELIHLITHTCTLWGWREEDRGRKEEEKNRLQHSPHLNLQSFCPPVSAPSHMVHRLWKGFSILTKWQRQRDKDRSREIIQNGYLRV